jgi:peptidoglycan L-alanyl-D-glutamate endopeptidase CwlK
MGRAPTNPGGLTMPAPYVWSRASRARLDTCHGLLITLFDRVIKRPDLRRDLTVTCGHRGKAEQDAAVKSGASKLAWPRSKHNRSPSLAVDVAPIFGGTVSWQWPDYHAVAPAINAEWAAMQAEGLVPDGVTLTWGGDWARFPDGPHWQLDGVD